MTNCSPHSDPLFLGIDNFINGYINFFVIQKPPSVQNKITKKQELKDSVQNITKTSDYIITGACWVNIEYYSSNFNRYKNPGVYDIDNIIKPILDSLIGIHGVILDDSLFERVGVNWIDTNHDEHFEVTIEYPDMIYVKKEELLVVKSENGWCLPMPKLIVNHKPNAIVNYFNIWNSINNEDEYYDLLGILPIQQFIYHTKIRDKNYQTVDLSEIESRAR